MSARQEALVGVDVGTTNLKLAAITPEGRCLAVVRRPMLVEHPAPGEAQFNLAALRAGLVGGLRELSERLAAGTEVLAIGVDSIGESVVAFDRDGPPLLPCPTWFDRRVAKPPSYATIASAQRYDITGMVEDDIYSVHRINWFRLHAPEEAARASRWCNVADYAVHLFTGRLVTNPSLAARTGLLDRNTGRWSSPLLEAAGIREASLPEVVPQGCAGGRLLPAIAREAGLPSGIPIVHAGHDHPCAVAGCAIAEPGATLDSTGTAEAVKTLVPEPLPFERTRGCYDCYPHAMPGFFVLSGHLPASGALLGWLARLTGACPPGEPVPEPLIAQLLEEAAASPPGARGLRLVPFLGGSGSPWHRRDLRAEWRGLGGEHVRGDLARAALEATAAWLRINVITVREITANAWGSLSATGGGARSGLWLAIKSAMLGEAITVPDVAEAAAAGAALVAGLAVGRYASPREACRLEAIAGRRMMAPPALVEAYRPIAGELARMIAATGEGGERGAPA